ncbi:MAG: SapC family protein [Pseudomonadota bacterium]
MATKTENPNTNLPLFYKNPVALDAAAHKDWKLNAALDFSFTKTANAVPINVIEMPQICHFYPIAFSPDGRATPVALIGLRDNENLFLNAKSEWLSDAYIPSYIRRYPFIFSEGQDGGQLTLCIDDTPQTVLHKGEGQGFFDDKNGPSQLSSNALEFCKSYHAAAQQTLAFSAELAQSGLLVDRQAEITVPGDKKLQFAGFQIVDEAKLADLPDAEFLKWRKNGWLPFLYAHLFSSAQWQRLTRLLNDRMANGG